MSKKETTNKAVESIRKRKDTLDSQMEKMPVVKVGSEKPILPAPPIRPISPPPPERAIKPEQKQEVIQALLDAWMRFPYLRLGQLVCLASREHTAFSVEDGNLKSELVSFDHTKIRCDSWSHSHTMQCTLEYGHDGDRHINHLVGMSWKRF